MKPQPSVSLKAVTWPTEHGASVMLGESLAAGLLIALSPKGFGPALGWLFVFLMSQPLKIAAKDIRQGISLPRTALAFKCCVTFGLAALMAMGWSYWTGGRVFLLMLSAVLPLGAVHIWAVLHQGKKEVLAELSGVLALGAAGASVLAVCGYSLPESFLLWAILAVFQTVSVLCVRRYLRRMRQAHLTVSPKIIGIQQTLLGSMFVILLVLGFKLKLL